MLELPNGAQPKGSQSSRRGFGGAEEANRAVGREKRVTVAHAGHVFEARPPICLDPRQNSGRPGWDFDYLRLCDGDKGKEAENNWGPAMLLGTLGTLRLRRVREVS